MDTDPEATDCAAENFDLNNIASVDRATGDLAATRHLGPSSGYPLVWPTFKPTC